MSALEDHYFEELSPFDEAVESFKEELRGSVKKEITEQIEKLQEKVREQGEKLKSLATLEQDAAMAKTRYEVAMSRAERDAKQEVQKEGLRKLLDVLAEPRYRIDSTWRSGPKCEHCNENRQLEYTTPRGKPAAEQCECAATTRVYEVEEQFVHEMAKRSGGLVIWYRSTGGYFSESEDSISHSAVLKSPAGVSVEELAKRPSDYGYVSKEDAQRIADALNAQDKK